MIDKFRVWSLYYRAEIIWFVIGFILGYFIKNFLTWLDRFAVPNVPDEYKEDDWDWIV